MISVKRVLTGLAAGVTGIVAITATAVPAHAVANFNGDLKNSVNSHHSLRVWYEQGDCEGGSIVVPINGTYHGVAGSVSSAVASFRLEKWDGTDLAVSGAGGCISVNPYSNYSQLKVVVN